MDKEVKIWVMEDIPVYPLFDKIGANSVEYKLCELADISMLGKIEKDDICFLQMSGNILGELKNKWVKLNCQLMVKNDKMSEYRLANRMSGVCPQREFNMDLSGLSGAKIITDQDLGNKMSMKIEMSTITNEIEMVCFDKLGIRLSVL